MVNLKKALFGLIMATLLVFPMVSVISAPVSVVKADSLLCNIFPFIKNIGAFGISQTCTGKTGQVVNSTGSFINFFLNLIFIGLIILAVFIIIKSAIKYINSEGVEGKIEEAQKAIKAVFIGIGMLIVGLVGIFIVVAFFQASDALNTNNKPQDITNLENQGGGASSKKP